MCLRRVILIVVTITVATSLYFSFVSFVFSSGLTISPGILDLGEISVRTEQSVNCVIQNGSRKPVTFLGSSNFCGTLYCVSSEGIPHILERGELVCPAVSIYIHRPGPFALDVVFVNSDVDVPRLVIKVVGKAVESRVCLKQSPGFDD